MDSSFRVIKLFTGVLAGLLLAQSASAQQPRTAFVTSPESTTRNEQCGIDYEVLRAAASSVLRQNGYNLAQASNSGIIDVYVVANSLHLQDMCVVNLRLEFSFEARVRSPWNQNISAPVIICSRSTLLSGPRANMAARARDAVNSNAEVCISEEDRLRRR